MAPSVAKRAGKCGGTVRPEGSGLEELFLPHRAKRVSLWNNKEPRPGPRHIREVDLTAELAL